MRAEKEQALHGKAFITGNYSYRVRKSKTLYFHWFNHPLAALLLRFRVAFIKIERLEFIRGDLELADRVHLI